MRDVNARLEVRSAQCQAETLYLSRIKSLCLGDGATAEGPEELLRSRGGVGACVPDLGITETIAMVRQVEEMR